MKISSLDRAADLLRPWFNRRTVAVGLSLVIMGAIAQTIFAADAPSVMIVYHGGDPRLRHSPPLEAGPADGFTQATTREVNVEILARELQRRLEARHVRVVLRHVEAVREPKELLAFDGIVIGSPVWFSNVAYPIKRFFDTHLIRLYEHRAARLNDKVMSGFCTVMEPGESGPRGLQALMWGIEHLTDRRVEGVVIQTGESRDQWKRKLDDFAARLAQALKAD